VEIYDTISETSIWTDSRGLPGSCR
jgi:hypothetical protein